MCLCVCAATAAAGSGGNAVSPSFSSANSRGNAKLIEDTRSSSCAAYDLETTNWPRHDDLINLQLTHVSPQQLKERADLSEWPIPKYQMWSFWPSSLFCLLDLLSAGFGFSLLCLRMRTVLVCGSGSFTRLWLVGTLTAMLLT